MILLALMLVAVGNSQNLGVMPIAKDRDGDLIASLEVREMENGRINVNGDEPQSQTLVFSDGEQKLNKRIVDLENQVETQRKWRLEAEEKLKTTPVVSVTKLGNEIRHRDTEKSKRLDETRKASIDAKAVAEIIKAQNDRQNDKLNHIEKVVVEDSVKKTILSNFPGVLTFLAALAAGGVSIITSTMNRAKIDTKLQDIHVLVNGNLSKAQAEIVELNQTVDALKAQLLRLVIDKEKSIGVKP